jgi:hypothetical protein
LSVTEAEIRRKLGSWIGTAERQALQRLLAQVQGTSAPAQAKASGHHGIQITGSDSFIYWTQCAIDVARGTSLFSYVQAIQRIQESTDSNNFVGGWCHIASKTVTVCPRVSGASTKRYAVFLIHEGSHVVNGADEPTAIRIENKARRELGFWFMEGESTQHNELWRQDRDSRR